MDRNHSQLQFSATILLHFFTSLFALSRLRNMRCVPDDNTESRRLALQFLSIMSRRGFALSPTILLSQSRTIFLPLCEGGLDSSVSSIKRLLPRPLRLLVGVIDVYGAFAIVLTV